MSTNETRQAASWQLDPREALGPRRTQMNLLLLEAAIKCFSNHGVLETNATTIINFSKLSRTNFYHAFESIDDCFIAAHRISLIEIETRIVNALDEDQGGQEQLKSAIDAVLSLFDENPDLARLTVLEAPLVTPDIAEIYREFAGKLTAILMRIFGEIVPEGDLSPAVAESAIGAARQILIRPAIERSPSFGSLGPEVFVAMMANLLGHAAAEDMAGSLR